MTTELELQREKELNELNRNHILELCGIVDSSIEVLRASGLNNDADKTYKAITDQIHEKFTKQMEIIYKYNRIEQQAQYTKGN